MLMTSHIRQTSNILAAALVVGLGQPIWAGTEISPPRWNRQPIALASDDKAAPAMTDASASLPLRAIQTAAMQQVEDQLNREKGLLRQELLAADTREITALKAAMAAAMKSGNVNAVLAAHHLLKTAQLQRQDDHTAPPFVGPPPASTTTLVFSGSTSSKTAAKMR